MDLARPVDGRPGTQLDATGWTKAMTGNVQNSVTWRASDGFFDVATARLRPRYRDGSPRSATGEAYRA
jgi:hypothetical protein